MTKKVCIVGEFPPPSGGIAQQAEILSDKLKIEGLKVYRVDSNLFLKTFLAPFKNVKLIKTCAAFICFLGQLVRTIPKVDVVHILSSSYLNYFLFTIPAIYLSKLYGKKIIVNYHGGAADLFFSQWGPIVKKTLNNVQQIVVPSFFLKKVFAKYEMVAEIVPNIADLSLFVLTKKNLFLPKILIARHLEPVYNTKCAIKGYSEILKKYPEAVLTIAGDGSERIALESMVEKLGLSKSVIFLGRVPNNKMKSIYKNSDIFINTSRVDNMPVSIMEAFASGCPVITTNVGGIPYLVNHMENGILIDSDDHKALANAVSFVVEHPEKANQLVNSAKKTIDKFSWNYLKQLYLSLY